MVIRKKILFKINFKALSNFALPFFRNLEHFGGCKTLINEQSCSTDN